MTKLNLESLVLSNVSVNGVNNVVVTGSDRLGSRLANPRTPALQSHRWLPMPGYAPTDPKMQKEHFDAPASRAGRPAGQSVAPRSRSLAASARRAIASRWPRITLTASRATCSTRLTARERGLGIRETTRVSTRGTGA
jgi:hypothetical protein